MGPRDFRLWKGAAALGFLFSIALPPAVAQSPEAERGEPGVAAAIREQSVYIPYEKLRQTFEREGRGVFLPYEQFQELWQAARQKTAPPPEPGPPVTALITDIDNEATVSADVIRVEARLGIEVLHEGWHRVPLRLADAAIIRAEVGGAPARIIRGESGYDLLLHKQGNEPERIELALEYAKVIERTPGRNRVAFEAPRAAVSRWRVRIPEPGVQVDLHPMLAATEVPREPIGPVPPPVPEHEGPEPTEPEPVEPEPAPPAETESPAESTEPNEPADNAQSPADAPGEPAETEPAQEERTGQEEPTEGTAGEEAEEAAGDEKSAEEEAGEEPAVAAAEETVVLAFVGAAPQVRIEWTPRAEGATGLEALAFVTAAQQVRVGEGVVRTRVQLDYAISRAELGRLVVEVPADQRVVNVFDANVRQWSVEEEEGRQRIDIELFTPARGAQSVVVELEKFVEEGAAWEEAVPVVRALGVGRQQGTVVVQVAESLRAEAAAEGLMQIDAAELPPALAGEAWTFAYRYASVPYALRLAVEAVQPRLSVDALVEANLEPEQLTLDLFAVYTVERAGVFRMELEIPAGYEVRRVAGREAAGATAAAVDGYHVEGEENPRLIVQLSRRALGRVGLAVSLHRDLREAALLTPTGESVELAVGLPRAARGTVEREAGRILVRAPESLRVHPGVIEGLRSVSFGEALSGMEGTVPARGELRPVLAYAFTEQPAVLAVAAERRRPQVTVAQLLSARIEDGVVHYRASFFYDVRFSGVRQLRIDLPAALAPRVRNVTGQIRERRLDPPPADLDEGYVAWSLAGEAEILGARRVELVWEDELSDLEVGRTVDVDLPRLLPRGVDRAWGQIVLLKSETIDVGETGQPQGLRPIDPQHDLMPRADAGGAARAFEFHDRWQLTVAVTRYELEEVKRTSIERAVVRMVATRAGEVPVQAIYRMRSARQRIEVGFPEGASFDAHPLRVNGRPVPLEQGAEGRYFIPLTDRSADAPFILELRYTAPGGNRYDLPDFPEEPAAQRVFLCLYLPEEQILLGRFGPWTEEFTWAHDTRYQPLPQARSNGRELIGWAVEGVDAAADPAETFPTDGREFVFSTLRPPPAPGGSLRVATAHDAWFNGVLFALAVLAGVMLLPSRWTTRAAWIGIAVVVLVVAGVFAPTVTVQVFSGVTGAAVFVVVALWLVHTLVWALPRWAHAAGGTGSPGEGTVAAAEPPAAASETASPFQAEVIEPPPSAEAPGQAPPEAGKADCEEEGGKDHA